MAVVDQYTDSNITSAGLVNKLLKAVNSAGGSGIRAAFATFEVAAADSDGSVYRVFKGIDPNAVPLFIAVANDAITAGTDYDIGLYKTDLGVVIDADLLNGSGLDLSSAHALSWAAALDGMAGVAIENRGKSFRELADASVDNHDVGVYGAYDLCVTANTVGSAAGTVSVLMIYAI